jgi:GNAT superfamily N-acetyltransferase
VTAVLRPALREDLAWLWPAVRAAQLFDGIHELEAFRDEDSWRVRVNTRGEATLLVRWRAHLDIVAMKGLWCSERRVPALLADIRDAAREHGFARLLSPLLPVDFAKPYLREGMEPVQEIIVLRMPLKGRRPLLTSPGDVGVTLRVGSLADLPEVTALDGAAFEEFWRYDEDMLAGYIAHERLGLAVRGDTIVGYTLCTVRGDEASLGRLAVHPDLQGHGVGAVLLEDALAYLERTGADRVSLCTQTENVRSRSLYRHAGMTEVPGRLLALLSGPL